MREIKFRGWNKDQGKMIDLKAITPFALDPTLFVDGLFLPFCDTVILMQYTGLKDKKGVEIYEGDIIQWHEDELADMGEKIIHHEGIGQVTWEKEFCHFGIRVIPKQIGHYSFSEDARYEIIGNVHQNPELLETP